MMQNKRFVGLSDIASTLACDAAGVNRAVDSIARRIDGMVLAVQREDWQTVGEASRALAQNARTEGYSAISALAERVCAESSKPKNVLGIKRSMIRLLGVHGRIPHRTATS